MRLVLLLGLQLQGLQLAGERRLLPAAQPLERTTSVTVRARVVVQPDCCSTCSCILPASCDCRADRAAWRLAALPLWPRRRYLNGFGSISTLYLVEVFLCMRANLYRCLGTDMLFYFAPLPSVELQRLDKPRVLLLCPSLPPLRDSIVLASLGWLRILSLFQARRPGPSGSVGPSYCLHQGGCWVSMFAGRTPGSSDPVQEHRLLNRGEL